MLDQHIEIVSGVGCRDTREKDRQRRPTNRDYAVVAARGPQRARIAARIEACKSAAIPERARQCARNRNAVRHAVIAVQRGLDRTQSVHSRRIGFCLQRRKVARIGHRIQRAVGTRQALAAVCDIDARVSARKDAVVNARNVGAVQRSANIGWTSLRRRKSHEGGIASVGN